MLIPPLFQTQFFCNIYCTDASGLGVRIRNGIKVHRMFLAVCIQASIGSYYYTVPTWPNLEPVTRKVEAKYHPKCCGSSVPNGGAGLSFDLPDLYLDRDEPFCIILCHLSR